MPGLETIITRPGIFGFPGSDSLSSPYYLKSIRNPARFASLPIVGLAYASRPVISIPVALE